MQKRKNVAAQNGHVAVVLARAAAISIVSFGCTISASADTAIETETAQIGKQGDFAFSQSYEYGRSQDGTSGGTLTQFEYALSDRAEILIEPFFYTWDHPKGEDRVSGLGDLEITPSYEVSREDNWAPSILTAVKVKVPTGSRDAGSSGKFDFMPYLIFGQHLDGWTFNSNIGVNFSKPEDGGNYEATAIWAVEAEREIVPDLTVFVEAFSTEEHVKTVSTALEYKWADNFNTFAAASYTEDHESIFRIGFNFED
jgi:hypothetical protein